MDTKGFEKKPWFPYLKNMYDEIEGDMMAVDAKGYEEKPWWPYVLDLQEKIDAGGGGGSSDFSTAEVTLVNNTSNATVTNINAPLAFEENVLGEGAPAASFPNTIQSVEPEGTVALKVILYKGNGIIDLASNSSHFDISLSGDIESIGAGMVLVHGNGTITFSNKQ